MPYIGNTPALDYISYAVQNFTVTAGTTVYTLDYSVSNENDIRLVLNNVIQRPGASYAYSATGTTLTLTSATQSGDTMYAVFIGRAVQTVVPPASSVTNTMLSPSVITGQTAVTTPATDDVLLCYDTSATALRKITFADFGNTPAFQATINSSQSITTSADTKAQFAVEDFDTDSCYDNTTNYRFTPNVAGKYFVYTQTNLVTGAGAVVIQEANTKIKKNGTSINVAVLGAYTNNFANVLSLYNGSVIDFNGTTDYVEVFVETYISSGTVTLFQGSPVGSRNVFGAYRLIGV